MLKLAFLIALFAGMSMQAKVIHAVPLGNPTYYTFPVGIDAVEAACLYMSEHDDELLPSTVFVVRAREDGDIVLILRPHYSQFYWAPDTPGAPMPSIDGTREGALERGVFSIHIKPSAAGTEVSLVMRELRQITGSRYSMFPDFRRVPIYRNVKSNSFFEYTFLRALGQRLGIKDMPELITEKSAGLTKKEAGAPRLGRIK